MSKSFLTLAAIAQGPPRSRSQPPVTDAVAVITPRSQPPVTDAVAQVPPPFSAPRVIPVSDAIAQGPPRSQRPVTDAVAQTPRRMSVRLTLQKEQKQDLPLSKPKPTCYEMQVKAKDVATAQYCALLKRMGLSPGFILTLCPNRRVSDRYLNPHCSDFFCP